MVIRELLVKLGVITDTAKVKDFDGAVEDAKKNLEGLADFAKKAAAAGAALGTALGLQGVATARAAEQADRMARSLGIGVEAAQGYAAIFEGVGADAKDVADAFNTLADRSQDAQDGMQSFIDDFSLLGLAVDDLRGKSPEDLFLTFADGVERTSDVVKRNAAVVRLLGDDVGNRLLPVMMQGSAGITQMRAEAERLGLVMSTDDVAAGVEAAEAFRRFGRVLTGLRNQVGLAVVPTMIRLGALLQEFIARNRVLIRERLERAMERFGDAVDTVRGALAKANDFVADRLGGWENLINRAASALAVFAGLRAWAIITSVAGVAVGAIEAIATALGLLGAGATLTLGTAIPVVLGVAAAVAALYLVVDDLITYFRGGESVLGDFLAQSELGRAILQALGEVGVALAGAFRDVLVPAFVLFVDLVKVANYQLGPFVGQFARMFGRQALAGLKAFAAGVVFLTTVLNQLITTASDLMAVLGGDLSVGDALGRFGGRLKNVVSTGGKAAAQGLLAIPGLGVLTAGGGLRGDRVPVNGPPPAAPLVQGGGGVVGGSSNTVVEGDTYNVQVALTEPQFRELARTREAEKSWLLNSVEPG